MSGRYPSKKYPDAEDEHEVFLCEEISRLQALNEELVEALDDVCGEYSDLMSDTWGQANDETPALQKADALEWRPPKGKKYGMVWHDIWPDICADNMDDFPKLTRKFARRSDWQDCWASGMVRHARRQEREQNRYWR